VVGNLRNRIVGRRRPYRGGLEGAQGFFEMASRLRGNAPFIPRGVYRFKSHEDLDAWTLKMLTRPKAGRPQLPTS
jgi:hypothetical protein